MGRGCNIIGQKIFTKISGRQYIFLLDHGVNIKIKQVPRLLKKAFDQVVGQLNTVYNLIHSR